MSRVVAHGVILGTILSAVAWLIAAPAVAQRSQDWELCGVHSTPPDQRIAACTAIVGALGEPPANVAMAYCNRGIAYQRKGDLARAMADFNEAIRLEPSSPRTYVYRGHSSYSRGDMDRALADYNQAIELDPQFSQAYVSRGLTYRAKGDLERALANYDEAIRLDPRDAFAFAHRGSLYEDKNEYGYATSDYNEAIDSIRKMLSPYEAAVASITS